MTASPQLVKNENSKIRTTMRDTSGQDRVLAEQRSPLKRIFWISGLLVVAAIVWFVVIPAMDRWLSADRAVARDRLRLATVTQGEFVRDVGVQGRVTAAVSPTLYAPVQGTVTVNVTAGDAVNQGEILGVVDSPELNNRLATEDSTLKSSEVALERQRIETKKLQLENQQLIDLAKVRLDAADREQRRAQQSYDAQVISQIDYEKAQDDLETARVEYQHAVANAKLQDESLIFELKNRELELDRQRLLVQELQRQVTTLTIISPVDGIVGNLLVDQKAAVTLNQPLLVVVDLSALEIEAQVPESYADDLALGMDAEVTYGQQRYTAQISSVSPEIQNNQVAARVRFVGEKPPGLKQNQRVSVRVILESKPNTLMVQRGAFLDSGSGRIAYVVNDKTALRRPIQVGNTSVSQIEILNGLSEGETIVISNLAPFDSAETVLITD